MGSWPWICDFTLLPVWRWYFRCPESSAAGFSCGHLVDQTVLAAGPRLSNGPGRSLVGREEGMTCVPLSFLLPLGIRRVLHG